jgi:rhamnulokinase/L-fuculokinase
MKDISSNNKRIISLSDKVIPEIIYPSNKVGRLKYELVEELDIYPIDVVSVGSHDTASAIAAIKLDSNSAYLSSGTWSLLGVELLEPLINENTYNANFTNEIGLEHTVRFLKNIMGLFIIQEIKKDYEKDEPNISFQTLQDEALLINDNEIYIDVEDEIFQKPGDMLNKYFIYLKKSNQYKENLSRGQIIRSIYESMAFNYYKQFALLKELTKRDLNKITVIGGGINAKILNQLIANSLNIIVETGESESTVYGNAIAQFIYLKTFKDLTSARYALAKNTIKQTYYPTDVELYQEKYQNYLNKIGGKNNE